MKGHWQFNLTSMKLYYNYCYLSLCRQALSSSPAEGEAAWRRKNGENGKFRLFPGCCSPSQPKHKNSLSCCELFLAVWNRMDVGISKNKTVTVVINWFWLFGIGWIWTKWLVVLHHNLNHKTFSVVTDFGFGWSELEGYDEKGLLFFITTQTVIAVFGCLELSSNFHDLDGYM